MEFIFGLLLGMLIATLIIRWAAQRAINKLLTAVEQENETEENTMQVNVEFDQNTYLLYNNVDGSFIAQGANIQELKQHLRHRFPNKTITVVNGNPEALIQLKQQLKEFNENSHSVGSPS